MQTPTIPKHIQERLLFASPKHSGSSVNDIPNETVPLVLEKVIQTEGCESCAIELTEPRVVHHKKLIQPYTHWSHQCKTCNMYQCVKTGEYKLTNIELRNQHNEIAGKKPSKSTRLIPNAKIGRPLGAKNKKKSLLLDK
tara:strand:+ start:336 stop:752 length:417 start_codon:yes stop_codon:yes gene_type:complete